MSELTNRQQQVLDMLVAFQQKNGFPPTNCELATMISVKSPNAVAEHLRALQRKGAITIIPNQSRGIIINKTKDNPDSYVVSLVRSLVDGDEYAREHAIAWLETHEKKPCA
ncbi:LexA family protein [Pluralibacter gergoviae]